MRFDTCRPLFTIAVISLSALMAGLSTFRRGCCQTHAFETAGSPCANACEICSHRIPRGRLPGWMGRPWEEPVSGGCRCGKYSQWTNLNFSSAWTSPFSVWLDYGPQGNLLRETADTRNPRMRDCLDSLAGIRLLPPVRKDNGYSGYYCDPFGHVGRSWQSLPPQTMAPIAQKTHSRVAVEVDQWPLQSPRTNGTRPATGIPAEPAPARPEVWESSPGETGLQGTTLR